MRAERDVRIRNRMMAALLNSTKAASAASKTLPGETGRPAQGTGGSGGCRQKYVHSEKASKLDTGKDVHPIQPVQRAQDITPPRVFL